MKPEEIVPMEKRIAAYRELNGRLSETRNALYELTRDWPSGPHGSGPFTGNTRESRQVVSMHIDFSPTRGGAPACATNITDMHIEAYEVGLALKRLLEERRDMLVSQMEKL